MKNHLIIIVNNDIDFGKGMNAIAHMMIGVGPRIPIGKLPKVDVFFGSTEIVREFKKLAYELNSSLTDKCSIYSDFAHTTTAGTAQDHQRNTNQIKESEIKYYAVCICAEFEKLEKIYDVINKDNVKKLKMDSEIKDHDDENYFMFEPAIQYPNDETQPGMDKKIKVICNGNLSTVDTIQVMIRTCLKLATQVNYTKLRLRQYTDVDSSKHPGMSEYGLVVLKSKKDLGINALNKSLSGYSLDLSACIFSGEKILGIAIFGDIAEVNKATKKNIELWKGKIAENDLVADSESNISYQSSFSM